MSTAAVLGHLAQTGAEHAMADAFGRNRTSHNSTKIDDDSAIESVLSLVLGILPIITLILGFAASYLLDYVLFQIVCTFASVETPVPGGVPSEKYNLLSDVQAASKRSDERAVIASDSYYVSSGIRSTLRHLQAEAGDMSMFRGMGAQMALQATCGIVMMSFQALIYYPTKWLHVGRFTWLISTTLTCLAMAQAGAALSHIVISKPRNKFWFRRLPLTFFSSIKIFWIPILIDIFINESIENAPTAFSYIRSRPKPVPQPTGNTIHYSYGPMVELSLLTIAWAVLRMFLRSLVQPVITVFLTVPLSTVQHRIEASILPDEDDPIIPIDRSFGGGPNSGLLHQQQPLAFIPACKSVDKATYMRITKVNLKCRIIKETLNWAFWTLLFAEIAVLVGPSAIWVVLKICFGVPIVGDDMNGVSEGARAILDKVIVGPKVAPLMPELGKLNFTSNATAAKAL